MPPLHDHDNLGGSNRWLNVEEAAEFIDVPVDSLRKLWKRWGITAYKIGGRLKFRERDLNAWIAKRVAA